MAVLCLNGIQVINPQLSLPLSHASFTSSFPSFVVPVTCNSSQPCPVNAYTTEEYDIMRIVAGIVSTVGFTLNVYMAATWFVFVFSNSQPRMSNRVTDLTLIENKYRAIAGRRHFKYEVRPQIRNTVFLGILYGLIDTLPMVYFFRHVLHPSDTILISYLLVFNIPSVGYEI
jgi:hypothetical protein